MVNTDKQLLFSLSKDAGDFVVQPIKCSGHGGQKINKTMSGCRIIHPASGTVSECQEERSFAQNRKTAFLRLLEKDSFKKWFELEYLRRSGEMALIEAAVEKAMDSSNLQIECQVGGRWESYGGD